MLLFLTAGVLYSSTDIVGLKCDYSSGVVKIAWQSTAEINVKDFTVEKSSDNINFSALTSENPKGSYSDYTVLDMNPHSKGESLYYRIKIADYDGTSVLSDPASVTIDVSGISATWGSIKALFR
ncbi:MAG: hypothetical protein R6V47_00630 [Candidatus Delongbacteria bacterium]